MVTCGNEFRPNRMEVVKRRAVRRVELPFLGKHRQVWPIRQAMGGQHAESMVGHEPLHGAHREVPEVSGRAQVLPIRSFEDR